MFRISDISIGGAIVIIIVLIILMYIHCESNTNKFHNVLKQMDSDRNGIITRSELKQYFSMLKYENEKRVIDTNNIKKQVLSGFIRGFLMGIILSDFEGGIALGLVLGTINPVLIITEKSLL